MIVWATKTRNARIERSATREKEIKSVGLGFYLKKNMQNCVRLTQIKQIIVSVVLTTTIKKQQHGVDNSV